MSRKPREAATVSLAVFELLYTYGGSDRYRLHRQGEA